MLQFKKKEQQKTTEKLAEFLLAAKGGSLLAACKAVFKTQQLQDKAWGQQPLPEEQPALLMQPLVGACELTQGFMKSLPCAVFTLTMESHSVSARRINVILCNPMGSSVYECRVQQAIAGSNRPAPVFPRHCSGVLPSVLWGDPGSPANSTGWQPAAGVGCKIFNAR